MDIGWDIEKKSMILLSDFSRFLISFVQFHGYKDFGSISEAKGSSLLDFNLLNIS